MDHNITINSAGNISKKTFFGGATGPTGWYAPQGSGQQYSQMFGMTCPQGQQASPAIYNIDHNIMISSNGQVGQKRPISYGFTGYSWWGLTGFGPCGAIGPIFVPQIKQNIAVGVTGPLPPK